MKLENSVNCSTVLDKMLLTTAQEQILTAVTDGLVLVIALRPQTPKHTNGGWSHYSDTSEPVDGNGAQNMVTIQSGFRTRDLSIPGPTR
jgi:hypothetical protein